MLQQKQYLIFLHTLYKNKGIQLKNIDISNLLSIENYSNWLLNDDVLYQNFYLDYEAKTISLYNQLVEFPNLHFIINKSMLIMVLHSMFVVLLIGILFILIKLDKCIIVYRQ